MNQHGENRGDEAAMRAMIRGLNEALGGEAEFDIMVQFRDRSLVVPFEQSVRLHHMVMPMLDIARIALYAVSKATGLNATWLVPTVAKPIIAALKDADLIISAPGGPYFGDIYASHEPLHWLYVWLARLHGKPTVLYATSAGPFKKPVHNWFRRRIFGMFDKVCLREQQSVTHVRALLGAAADIKLTADSAIQDDIKPYERSEYFGEGRGALAGKFIVAVTGMQYRYPGDPDPALKRAQFTEVFVTCLKHLANRRDCHFIFLPQLYGNAHDDRLYHELLGRRLPVGTSWEVIPAEYDSDQHRKVFGMADFCLASRYHPQIFATSSGVPGVFACYEHKQFAYLESVGMQEYAFDIRNLDAETMCRSLDEVLEKRDALSASLRENIVKLRKLSRETTSLAAGLIGSRSEVADNAEGRTCT